MKLRIIEKRNGKTEGHSGLTATINKSYRSCWLPDRARRKSPISWC